MISNRRQVLEDLKDVFEKITRANDYQVDVAEVRRGLWSEKDMTERPALTYWNEKATKEGETFDDRAARKLHIMIIGYIDHGFHDQNYDELDKFISSVEKVLDSRTDNPYWEYTQVGEITIYEGSVINPVGIFLMGVTIRYDYDITDP